ncbi:MAG: Translation machinery-associated protein 22 [Cirrosporium novae-zelandiae]|nr:MAG: Translation machinery-associated protein 22 [Cirrosporium novae-zelandiae]
MTETAAADPATLEPQARHVVYCGEAITAGLSSLSVEAQKRAQKDATKKAAQAAKAEEREAERIASSTVIIKRIERNKRKYVTSIQGLEAFGLDNKKIAKELGKKFATGSSMTKLPGGIGEEIVVQGDVSDDVIDWLEEKYGDKVPSDNVEFVEDKKKKT